MYHHQRSDVTVFQSSVVYTIVHSMFKCSHVELLMESSLFNIAYSYHVSVIMSVYRLKDVLLSAYLEFFKFNGSSFLSFNDARSDHIFSTKLFFNNFYLRSPSETAVGVQLL